MKNLNDYRDAIDKIDEQLMKLFEDRMLLAKQVVEYKKANGLEIYQPEREKQVIEKNVKRIKNEKLKPYGETLLTYLMDLSKEFQSEELNTLYKIDSNIMRNKIGKNVVVGYQGVEGSFSQEAMYKYFNEDVQSVHYPLFEGVFKHLANGNIDYGILPIENSSTGAINDVFDLIKQYGVYIVGEIALPIKQYLLGIKGASVDTLDEVFSHPQGLYQTSNYLKQYPMISQTAYHNTAMAAKHVYELNDKTKGAIASLKAAELYHLEVLKESIQNVESNHTRFIIISKNLGNKKDNNTISILFTLKHCSGTLSNILKIIAKYGLNMINIQSRPVIKTLWEYYFYVDFTGNIEDENVLKALEIIKQHCESFRLLGVYKHE